MTNAITAAFRKQLGADDDVLTDAEGFTLDYLNYASPLTEAPERYHAFAALVIVSAVVGRKVFLPFGARDIYPNVWVALVGKSSQLKKSTALRIASDVIAEHDAALVYPDEFSAEALFAVLEKQPTGVFVWNELGGLLKAFEKNYMAGTKELLTELFDCPPVKGRELKSKSYVIRDACPVALCASTVDWLNGNLSQVDLRSGFAARFVYVPAEKPSKILPIPPRRNLVLRDKLLAYLARFSQLSGEMNLSPDAGQFYVDWYGKMHREIEVLPAASRVHAFASRLENYALKFAMLYQIARSESLTIDEDALWRGCTVAEWLFDQAKVLVDEEFSCSTRERDLRELEDFIRSHKAVQRQQVTRQFRKHKSRDLDDLLLNLTESGMVRTEKAERGSKMCVWVGPE